MFKTLGFHPFLLNRENPENLRISFISVKAGSAEALNEGTRRLPSHATHRIAVVANVVGLGAEIAVAIEAEDECVVGTADH